MPGTAVLPSLSVANGEPVCSPLKEAAARFEITVPLGVGDATVTRKRTLVAAATARRPPAAPVAPVPRRITTLRLAGTYSAWSSPAASVLAPAFAPVTTTIEPGTNTAFAGSVSRTTVLTA